MKIKLSKRQWEFIGRKAGWSPINLGDATDRDLDGALTPDEEEDLLLGPNEEVTPEMVYKDGYEAGLRDKKHPGLSSNPYRTDTDEGVKKFDQWREGFRDAEKGIPPKH
jgi:hypothetical protein